MGDYLKRKGLPSKKVNPHKTKTPKSAHAIPISTKEAPPKKASPSDVESIYLDTLKKFWSMASQGFVLLDSDFNIIDMNQSALQGMKKKKADVVGKNLTQVFPYLKGTKRLEQYQTVVKTGKTLKISIETKCANKNVTLDVHAFKAGNGLGLTITSKQINQAKRDSFNKEAFREFSHHLTRLREEERTHLAREIHDQLAPVLTALNMDFSWFRSRLDGIDTDVASPIIERVDKMQSLTDMTVDSLKNICSRLRPVLLEDLGLIPAIEWEIQATNHRAEIDFSLDLDMDGVKLNENKSLCIFRVFQEAVTNIIRHSEATKVKVSLKTQEDSKTIEMTIKDNGKGIPLEKISCPKSFGLIGMKERLHSLNGNFQITGIPNKGTTVFISFPFS